MTPRTSQGHWNWHLNFKRKAWKAQSQTWKPLQLLKVWGWKHFYCPTSQAMALQEGLPKPAGRSTPSLPWCHLKTINKSVKSETFKGFCLLFHTGMWKDFHQNTDTVIVLVVLCTIGSENTLFIGMSVLCASFSPEVLQTGAVKRLTVIITILDIPTDP